MRTGHGLHVARLPLVAVAALLALVGTLGSAPATSAAETSTLGPSFTVRWSLGDRSASGVSAGRQVRIRVLPRAGTRRDRAALVTVTRRIKGAPSRNVVHRRVRRGTVAVRLSSKAGVRYELRVRSGSRTVRRVLRTRLAPPDAPTPTPPVPPPAPAPDGCPATGLAAVEATIVGAAPAPGGTLSYVVRNTGQRCLSFSRDAILERAEADGTWTAVPRDGGSLPVQLS